MRDYTSVITKTSEHIRDNKYVREDKHMRDNKKHEDKTNVQFTCIILVNLSEQCFFAIFVLV